VSALIPVPVKVVSLPFENDNDESVVFPETVNVVRLVNPLPSKEVSRLFLISRVVNNPNHVPEKVVN
jgi:hypothetical protein